MKKKHLQAIMDEINIGLGRADTANAAMVKMLADRLSRIETAQNEVVRHLRIIMEDLADFSSSQDEYFERQKGDELDRGQTASALHGLIKRLDGIDKSSLAQLKNMLKEKA